MLPDRRNNQQGDKKPRRHPNLDFLQDTPLHQSQNGRKPHAHYTNYLDNYYPLKGDYSSKLTNLNSTYADSSPHTSRRYQNLDLFIKSPERGCYQKYQTRPTRHLCLDSYKTHSGFLPYTPREKKTIDLFQDTKVVEGNPWNLCRKVERKKSQNYQEDLNPDLSLLNKLPRGLMNSQVSTKKSSQDSSKASSLKTSPYESPHKIHGSPELLKEESTFETRNKLPFFSSNGTSKSRPSPPTTITDFYLGKVIGRGMFGKVFVARLKSNGAIFAIKQISKILVVKNRMEAQLALEIKLQMFISHPNILRLYHFFEDSDSVYLVMQYMEEGSLFHAMQKRDKKMSEREAAGVLIQVSNALVCLHDLDIVHRDLKPENIVISNGIHKLCDFGWATICSDRRSTFCGTFNYAAPEVLEGKEYDTRVDLWCLGVLAFELLTCKVPYSNACNLETIHKITNSDMECPSLPSSLSSRCRQFVLGLLRKRPQERLRVCELLSHPFLSLHLSRDNMFY